MAGTSPQSNAQNIHCAVWENELVCVNELDSTAGVTVRSEIRACSFPVPIIYSNFSLLPHITIVKAMGGGLEMKEGAKTI